jgi:hypothetical protein
MEEIVRRMIRGEREKAGNTRDFRNTGVVVINPWDDARPAR